MDPHVAAAPDFLGRGMGDPAPYVGAVPFQRDDAPRFFGRERETDELVSLIEAHSVVLVYAQSGAGKTSLLNAGIIPALESEEVCQIFPPARLSVASGCDEYESSSRNTYMCAALDGWQHIGEPEGRDDRNSLRGFLSGRKRPRCSLGEPALQVLFFDQVEEIFTSGGAVNTDRADFFEQVREALAHDRLLRVVFCVREDYLAELEPFARLLPDGFRTRYRLERLRRDAARRALEGPLESTPYRFAEGAAEQIVSNLLTTRWVDRLGDIHEVQGEFVEPVQLGVVSEFLWRGLRESGSDTISADFTLNTGGVESALQAFYETSLVRAGTQDGGDIEWQLRRFFQHDLIAANGVRSMCLRGKRQTQGIPNQTLDRLVDLHLLRTEWRANATWYELAHDRFVSPVRQANRTWLLEKVQPGQVEALQRLELAAGRWKEGGRRPEELLTDAELREAESLLLSPHVKDLGLSEALRSCIEGSRAARQTRELNRLRRHRARLTVAVSAAAACALICFEMWNVKRVEATRTALSEAEMNRAYLFTETRRLELEAGRARDLGDAEAAARLESESRSEEAEIRAADDKLDRTFHAAASAGVLPRDLTVRSGGVLAFGLHRHYGQVFGVSYSSSGLIAAAYADGTTRVWNPGTGSPVRMLLGHANAVVNAVFSPDGRRIATASHDRKAKLWDSSTGREIRTFNGNQSRVWAVAFSPDGKYIATAGEDRTARVWEIETGTLRAALTTGSPVFAVAFAPDGRLATGGADNRVTIWDVATRHKLLVLREHEKWVWSVAFSPDGTMLASAGFDGKVVVDDLEGRRTETVLDTGARGQLGIVTFDPRSQRVAVGSVNGSVTLWNARSGARIHQLQGRCGPIYGVAFCSSGSALAAGCQEGALLVFPISETPTPNSQRIQ